MGDDERAREVAPTAAADSDEREVDLKFVRVYMSRRQRSILGGLALVGVVLFGLRWAEWWPFEAGKVAVRASVLTQMRHAQLHFEEPPEWRQTVYDDARGRLSLASYRSDGCLSVGRARPGASTAGATFVLEAEPSAPPMPAPEDLAGYPLGAAPAWAVEGGRCLDPHPGAFEQVSEEIGDPCWMRVWRTWGDSCRHHQGFNRCGNYWDAHPDGSPRVFWTRCVH